MKIEFYKPYMGYVREVSTYLGYPFLPKLDPTKKFVIFTVGRSGSTLLVSLLHSHEQIHCDDELFRRKLFSPSGYLKCKTALSPKSVYGFKLNTYHFRDQKIKHPKEFLGQIHQSGYQIISLVRQNIVRQAISHMYALQRDKFHHTESQGQLNYDKFVIDMGKLQEELTKFEKFTILHRDVVMSYPHLEICYEDDLLDSGQHQATVDRIADFLGISSAKVSTKLKKTTPRQLADFVTNYDDVKDFLKNSKYAEYVEE